MNLIFGCLIHIFPLNNNSFVVKSIDLPPAVIGLNRQMTAEPSIDQHHQFNFLWSSKRLNSSQSSADAASGIKHIIDKNHFFIFDQKIDLCFIPDAASALL